MSSSPQQQPPKRRHKTVIHKIPHNVVEGLHLVTTCFTTHIEECCMSYEAIHEIIEAMYTKIWSQRLVNNISSHYTGVSATTSVELRLSAWKEFMLYVVRLRNLNGGRKNTHAYRTALTIMARNIGTGRKLYSSTTSAFTPVIM
jgi:outer membrane protein assembly factor BamB